VSDAADADIALLRQVLRQWEQGDFWDAAPYADDVVFVRAGPDPGEYHGLDGLATAWRDFLGAWEDFRIAPERIVPADGGTYVLLIRLQGRGKGSGMEIDAEVANLVRMRDGRIAHLEMHWDREAALTAAGASEGAG